MSATDEGQSLDLKRDLGAVRDQTLAVQLLISANAAVRVFRIHATKNAAVEQPLRSITSSLEELFEHSDRVVLAQVEGIFYLGDMRVRLSGSQQTIADQFARELNFRGLGGLIFESVPSQEELVSLFQVLNETSKGNSAGVEGVRRAMREAHIQSIRVFRVLKAVTQEQKKEKATHRAADIYTAAIAHAASLYRRGGASKRSARSKRIIQELVDLSATDTAVLLALAGLRGTDSGRSEHAVTVAVLSVAIGNCLGFDKNVLVDLGLAAIYHEQGLEGRDANGGSQNDQKPALAIRSLLGQGAPDDGLLRQAIVGYEHQLDHIPPGNDNADQLHPLSQIVRLANDFDELTRGDNSREAMDVAEAVATLEAGGDTLYHPGLLNVFADMVGGVVEEEGEQEQAVPEPVVPIVAPEPVEPAANELDMMLADFLGTEQPPPKPVPPPVEAAPISKPPPSKRRRSKTLGVLKLKKIRKPRVAASA